MDSRFTDEEVGKLVTYMQREGTMKIVWQTSRTVPFGQDEVVQWTGDIIGMTITTRQLFVTDPAIFEIAGKNWTCRFEFRQYYPQNAGTHGDNPSFPMLGRKWFSRQGTRSIMGDTAAMEHDLLMLRMADALWDETS